MTSIKELRSKIERKKGRKEQIEKDIAYQQGRIAGLEAESLAAEQARTILQFIAQQTQQQIQVKFGHLVDLAQSMVFPRPYKLQFDFVPRRGRTEADLYLVRDERQTLPGFESGGGAVDIAGFALQAASLMIYRKRKNPGTRPVLLLDEPFKHLKGEEANCRAIEMVKLIAEHTGLQIIMVSDERAARSDIVAGADKVFNVSTDDNGVSLIAEV